MKRIPSRQLRWKDDLLGEGVEAGYPLVAAAADVLVANRSKVFDFGRTLIVGAE